jgi:predicted nuclease of predicted toxin-antitoxin system
MRFLVDRCAGHRLAEWLRSQGHDVLEAIQLGTDPGDEVLLQLASAQARITITIDSDFGTLIFRDSAAHAGLVRLPDVPSEQRIALMNDVLTRHAEALTAGAVVTVRGDRIRVSRP